MFYTYLVQPLTNGLVLFYKLMGNNLGLAIIAFSVVLRFILNPLTKPYMESMKKMKDFAPQLEKLKKKYVGDKIGLAKAQADFYKSKGVNPSAGCLPYVLQIIVLIAFFNVFTRTISAQGGLTQNFNNILYKPLKFSEEQIINTKFIYLDLTKPDIFRLPGIPFSLPGPIILLSAIAQFLSAKAQTPAINAEKEAAQSSKSETDDMQVVMQRSMIYTFPLFTVFIGMKFASALALYWLIFSFLQYYQQVGLGGMKEQLMLTTKGNLFKASNEK